MMNATKVISKCYLLAFLVAKLAVVIASYEQSDMFPIWAIVPHMQISVISFIVLLFNKINFKQRSFHYYLLPEYAALALFLLSYYQIELGGSAFVWGCVLLYLTLMQIIVLVQLFFKSKNNA